MRDNVLYQKLLSLDNYEALGKEYFQTYDKNLSYIQYLFLRRDSYDNLSIDKLNLPSSIMKQKEIEKSFHENLQIALNEQAFIRENETIEIEKLLRYIDNPPHHHTFVECSYVFSGTCKHTVSGHTFEQTAGTLSIITSGTVHKLEASPDCLCLTINIRHKTFINFQIPNLTLYSLPLFFNCKDDPFIQDSLLTMYIQQKQQKPYYELMIENLFQTILIYCIQNYRESMHFFLTGTNLQGKMLEIGTYIYENYQTVTLHSLAKHFHYSDAYLSNLIHQQSGINFSKMLRAFKMEQAKNLLQTTNLNLNDICDAIGYKDSSQFIRDFKGLYQMTPAKYRTNYAASDE